MSQDHVVTAYDEELQRLEGTIRAMGELAAEQLAKAVRVLTGGDGRDLAREVMAGDSRVDALEGEVDRFTVRLLALRQPMAEDLRAIVAALRISIDLERIADYAVSIAERALELRNHTPPETLDEIRQVGRVLEEMLGDALRAYRERDVALAQRVWRRDDEVDRVYVDLLARLRARMVADPDSVEAGSRLLFVCKSLERVGDHLTNVCEHVHYLVRGEPLGRELREPPS